MLGYSGEDGSQSTVTGSNIAQGAVTGTKTVDAAKVPARGRKPGSAKPTLAAETVVDEEANKAAETDEEKAQSEVLAKNASAKTKKTEETETEETKADESLADLMGEESSVKEITDKELNDATQSCQARVKNAPAIRKILAELGVKQPGGRLIDLPQDKRQTYIDKLKEVKPLA